MTKAKCLNCMYLVEDDENIFECHRYPPQMVGLGNALAVEDLPCYPRILSPKFEWCGEYREAKD